MKNDYLALAASMLDMEYIRKHTMALNALEISSSNSDFKASTAYVVNLMKEAGFADVERYALPCDGVTTYDDCTMPMAWDRTGRSTLEVVSPGWSKSDAMLADSDVQPLNATIWSPPTPEGGVTAELVSLKSVESDDWHELAGKIVLCSDSPGGDLMRKLSESGAVGLVSYVEKTLETNPDDVRWMNGVGHCGWYYVKGDKMLWNFSITPRRGVMLEEKLSAGEKITLKAVMNTRVYEGEIYTVTGRVPGKSTSEVAMFAHMYEPFAADDAAGVVISIAVAKAIQDLAKSGAIPPLEKSIRMVFSMERYGFSEYFSHARNTRKIISAMNMDSVCHTSLKLAGVLPELRHSPASAPFFAEVILREYLLKNYPEVPFRETPGNLSDDTFGACAPALIPTGWLHTSPAPYRHHCSGAIFSDVDWHIAECVFTVITAYFAELAVVRRGRGINALAKKVIKGVCVDAVRDFKRLEKDLKSGEMNCYAGNVIGEFVCNYHVRRVTALNDLVAKTVKTSEVKSKLNALRKKYAPSSFAVDIYELTNSELRMAYMTVSCANGVSLLMNLTRMPKEERFGFIAKPSPLLCALLDGKRNLYEAYVISKFMLGTKVDFKETAGLVAAFKKLAKYGYYTIKYADELSISDLLAALQALEVKNTDKVVVHSAYGSLGGVQGGPAAVAKTLAEYCGKKGLLMMPSFNFPFYLGRNDDEYFDVKETPSCVGIISEEFCKLPEVVRSLNPSHSMAVYGKKNFHWISDHHKVRTMGQNSPLGKLEDADGYALMIGCADSVTFMHVVEMTNNVHCLGQRTEEFDVKLPDGSVKPVRTWGWRGGSCRAYSRKAIFGYLREHGLITEVMVRHSLWQFFKLSDYRKAYEKTVLRGKYGCMQCPVLPRQVKNTVISDWDPEKNEVRKNTTAFTGDWEV